MHARWTDRQRRFAAGTVRRRSLFLALSLAGIAVAAGLAGYYGYRNMVQDDYPLGLRPVIVLLILLNARQNLRQYRHAGLLAQVVSETTTKERP